MKHIIIACAAIVLGATAAQAKDLCHVPKDQWLSISALKTALEDKNWEIRVLKKDDGCYEAYATLKEDQMVQLRKGQRVEAYFDPKTFDIVKMKVEE